MNEVLNFIINLIITGISGVLCLFLFVSAQVSDIYWDYVKKELDKNG